MLKGCMPLAALAVATSCVDDKYDLTDIDTTSRITVNNLTVPVNLQSILLDDVLDIDDTDLIITTTDAAGRKIYALQQGGDINTSDFSISGIHVHAPTIPSTHKDIDIPLGTLSSLGVTTVPETTLPSIALTGIPEQTYDLKLQNVDAALVNLDNIKTSAPITVEVILQINASIMSGNKVSFKNLEVKMPWGLMTESTDGVSYDPETGLLSVSELQVDASGKATFSFNATGLDLMGKGNLENHNLNISGNVGIESGEIEMTVTNIAIPSTLNLNIDYKVSSFDIKSFTGDIDYKMDDINIDPISLNDLPDFLDSPETEIRIANPTINVKVNNPVGEYGLEGYGQILLSSNFDNGYVTNAESDQFTISTSGASLSFGNPTDGYDTFVDFPGLGDILANQNVGGLPKSITVKLENLQFKGHAVDFPIGTIGKAQGDYQFTAPLGFASPSRVIYETEEAGWNSKDLDNVNIEYINLTAECYTPTLPVAIQLSVVPIDKYGNVIAVTEDSGNFEVPAYCTGREVSLRIQGKNGPIRNFDGIRFRAVISQDQQDNTDAIGPDLSIELRNIHVTVDGYYETDF